ncbi:MAG: GMC family oxidoreductase N-terminal domain-containing protein, partial [Xanthomonadales bacterium]|nr:GMC family oxidoreductase N-terminal domain-containing protein [Xanthomonadales bacterium]
GSSSINAMCYIRGHRSDYDHWASLGNRGWGYNEVLPYFRRAEANIRGSNTWHGDQGLLSVEDLRHTNPLSHVFIDAAAEAGYPRNPDFNGASQRGFGFYQVTQKDGARCSTAAGYLADALERTNLSVETHAQVERLEIQHDRVVAVHYRHHGSSKRVEVAGEVLLSGGAINSPQLLMLSGVGPADHLRGLDIKVRADLPGVGGNLQDHLDICTLQRCTQNITYDWPNEVMVALTYVFTRGGIGASNIAEAGGFALSPYATDDRPDIQFHFVPAMLDDHGRNRMPGNGYTVHACVLRPQSRGRISLASPDPFAAPRIHANYLAERDDLDRMVAAVRMTREILAQAAFRSYAGAEILPGAAVQDDAGIVDFIRRKAESIYHPVGTCKMGQDAAAVVDDELKVRGIAGLRVVDASIMPTLVGGNTNAPVIMIAERASDLILKSTGTARRAA